eukprot:512254_1
MSIKCLFFAEFDVDVGHKLTCQVPNGFLQPEVFSKISDYIITVPEMCDKNISLSVLDYKILGYPVRLESNRYPRNALLYSFGLILDPGTPATGYEAALRKLALSVRRVEVESGFLVQPSAKVEVERIIKSVFEDLNRCGRSEVIIDPANRLSLQLCPSSHSPPEIHSQDVPVCAGSLGATEQWDLAVRRVALHIDGVNSVKRIARLADMDESMVKKCVRQLVSFGLVEINELFLFSNEYCATPKISQLAFDPKLKHQCLDYLRPDQSYTAPKISDVLRLYSRLAPGTTLRDICNQVDLESLYLDLRRAIAFALSHNLIRRVMKYPVLPESSPRRSHGSHPDLMALCDGEHTIQQLSVWFANDDVERYLR